MRCDFIFYSEHAVVKMAERGMNVEEVEAVIQAGEVIRHYPDDQPAPSWLMLGIVNGRPIHVVFARDVATDFCIVITAYQPDETTWGSDFKIKRTV